MEIIGLIIVALLGFVLCGVAKVITTLNDVYVKLAEIHLTQKRQEENN